MSVAKSRKIELKPVPPEKIKEYIEKYRRLKEKTEIETDRFESPEAKKGFRQAEEVLEDGTLFDEFTEERLREQREKEEEQRLRDEEQRLRDEEQRLKDEIRIIREKNEEQTRINKINAEKARKRREERARRDEELIVLLREQYQREKRKDIEEAARVSSRQNASNHTKYGNDVLSGKKMDSSRTDWGWLNEIGSKKDLDH